LEQEMPQEGHLAPFCVSAYTKALDAAWDQPLASASAPFAAACC